MASRSASEVKNLSQVLRTAEQVVFEGEALEKAERTLHLAHKNHPSVELTDANRRIVMALQLLCPKARISGTNIMMFKKKEYADASVLRTIILVPRDQLPEVPSRLQKFLVSSDKVMGLPAGISPASVWFMDRQALNKPELEDSVGILERQIRVGQRAEADADGLLASLEDATYRLRGGRSTTALHTTVVPDDDDED